MSWASRPQIGQARLSGLSHWLICARQQWCQIALALGSFGAYFGPGHLPGLKAHPVPLLRLDQQIPLMPWTVYGYLSLYPLLLANLVYFIPRPRVLQPLLKAIGLANTLAGALFILYRTSITRPALRYTHGWRLLARVWAVDPPYNALPSLHTTYSLVVALTHIKVRSPYRRLVGLWSAIVIGTTLTTKQHQVLDLLGGTVLAAIVGQIMLRQLGPADLALGSGDRSPKGG